MADIENKGRTPNIGLIKPNADNFYSVKDANDNSDILDEVITKIYSCLGVSDPTSITSVDSRIDNKIKTAMTELIGVDDNLLDNLSTLNNIVSYFTDEDKELLEKINTASSDITTFKTSFFKWFGAESFPDNVTYSNTITNLNALIVNLDDYNKKTQDPKLATLFSLIGTDTSDDLKEKLKAIGEVTSLINALTTLKTTIGVLSDLSSISATNRTSLVSALKEVIGWIGTLSSLKTTNKNSLVLAINSLVSDISGVSTTASTNKDSIDEIISLIGNTTELSNGVAYNDYIFGNDIVNILFEIIGCMGDPDYIPFDTITESLDTHDIEIGDIRSDVGFTDDLETENKENLVSAINEMHTNLYGKQIKINTVTTSTLQIYEYKGQSICYYKGTLEYGDTSFDISANTTVGPTNSCGQLVLHLSMDSSTGVISSTISYNSEASSTQVFPDYPFYDDYTYEQMYDFINNSGSIYFIVYRKVSSLTSEWNYTMPENVIWKPKGEPINDLISRIEENGTDITTIYNTLNNLKYDRPSTYVIGTSCKPSGISYNENDVNAYISSISQSTYTLEQAIIDGGNIYLKEGIYNLSGTIDNFLSISLKNAADINNNSIVIEGTTNTYLSMADITLSEGTYIFKNLNILIGVGESYPNSINSNYDSYINGFIENIGQKLINIYNAKVIFENCNILCSFKLDRRIYEASFIYLNFDSSIEFNSCNINIQPDINNVTEYLDCLGFVSYPYANVPSNYHNINYNKSHIIINPIYDKNMDPSICFEFNLFLNRYAKTRINNCSIDLYSETLHSTKMGIDGETPVYRFTLNTAIDHWGYSDILDSDINLIGTNSSILEYGAYYGDGSLINNKINGETLGINLAGYRNINSNTFKLSNMTNLNLCSSSILTQVMIFINNIISASSDNEIKLPSRFAIIKNNIINYDKNNLSSTDTNILISDNIVTNFDLNV